MDFVPHTPQDWNEMLREIGFSSFEDLTRQLVPKDVKRAQYEIEKGLSEYEVLQLLKSKADLNGTVESYDSFLGAGAYHHFIPSVVNALASRGEFSTSYTPYQPEASQGTLQAIFEYQTMMARLTGLDVSNASLYDGSSAVAEAALMAMRVQGSGDRILVSETVNPQYREVFKTYLTATAEAIVEIPRRGGVTDFEKLEDELKKGATAFIAQWPNFLGCLEKMEEAGKLCKRYGALFILVAYPIALGVLKSPGELGADICVGEGQSLGNVLQFGGPSFGFMTCRKEFVRKMPGRLVGMTKDLDGRRGFVLTLQAREQHIRREKATSNICTNQSLNALMGALYLCVMGPEGFKKVSLLNLKKAHDLADLMTRVPGFSLAFPEPFFNEFVIRVPMNPEELIRRMQKKKIIPGLHLKPFYPDLDDALLVCVTEMMSDQKIKHFVEKLAQEANETVEHGKNSF
ncbi:MAG: aminomethyl-transferring glycine dehydrogenase subunit GcvPA [Chlamydiae bacterium]|nr:aminomethyl-transferring glycine dehydrogenase subunit GcvPA [Chlamydiota bacterium]MBI3267022.1 aminomethyl-transferring glycine dehydrogenase subunit GcvPA [Chlamydiota bacterium]